MVPLKSLAGDKTNVILAGDNKQLGPIVHSALAAAFGLKTSYLSRIMDREIYSLDPRGDSGQPGVGGQGTVKLLPEIFGFPSCHPGYFSKEQFSNPELQCFGDRRSPIL
ncbi:hypothetical protein MPER_02800 [Moniliophthora perniciosa FA553]|nr:hypothetical protein MPER_02800 [Moniliophthora perniciosa FA553]